MAPAGPYEPYVSDDFDNVQAALEQYAQYPHNNAPGNPNHSFEALAAYDPGAWGGPNGAFAPPKTFYMDINPEPDAFRVLHAQDDAHLNRQYYNPLRPDVAGAAYAHDAAAYGPQWGVHPAPAGYARSYDPYWSYE